MPKYSAEVEKKYRTGQMTKARVNDKLAFAGLNKEERERWWETQLVCMNGRSPGNMYEGDPLYVYLAAEAGITAENEHPKWLSQKGAILLGGAVCDCLTCQGAQTEPSDFTDTIPDEVVTDDADSRVREVVSADELDAVKDMAGGRSKDSVQGLPSWWT